MADDTGSTQYPLQVWSGPHWTDNSIDTRVKQNHWHILLEHAHKTALVAHSINLGHQHLYHQTKYMDIIREVTEKATSQQGGWLLPKQIKEAASAPQKFAANLPQRTLNMSPHMPGHTAITRHQLYAFQAPINPELFFPFPTSHLLYLALFITYCVPQHMYMTSVPPSSFLCLPRMTSPSCSVCMWLEQPIFGARVDTLPMCPTGWLFSSANQWAQTC
jgi:hypothetical protein